MLLQVFLITCITMVSSIDLSPGQPVPHADKLHKMLAANGLNYSSGQEQSLLDFLFNPNSTQDTNANDSSSENIVNLDVNVLNANNLKKIVKNARKWWRYPSWQTKHDKNEPSQVNTHFTEMAMRQMKQSIYAARYRIMSTAHIRKRFMDEPSYQIAILVGALNQKILACENIYTQMYWFLRKTQFIWYLIIYEKVLAAHVDVTYMVKKIFELNRKQSQKYNQ